MGAVDTGVQPGWAGEGGTVVVVVAGAVELLRGARPLVGVRARAAVVPVARDAGARSALGADEQPATKVKVAAAKAKAARRIEGRRRSKAEEMGGS